MGQFLYEARDDRGEVVTGVIAARTAAEAGRMLSGEKKNVTRISAAPDDASGAKPARTSRGIAVDRRDVILLANQMAVMIETGVPLADTLRGVAGRATDERFVTVLQKVIDDVESGEPLSKALARHPRAFPPIMTALVRASEASGTMGVMLTRIASFLTKQHQIMRQVRGALMYPAFMFLMCMAITMFLLTVILPKFATIYEGRSASLPSATRILMDLSTLLVERWFFWIAGLFVLGVGALLWRRTRAGRVQLDWLKLHVPVFSGIFSKLYLSQGCRTLGTMIETGVPLLEAVSIVKDVTRNVYYERLWDRVNDNLRRGKPFADALYESGVFPDHVAQMVEAGESSGRLGEVFSRVASFCESEFDDAVRTATQFIEPVMIVVMGAVIGFVAIALLLPIFNVARVAAGG